MVPVCIIFGTVRYQYHTQRSKREKFRLEFVLIEGEIKFKKNLKFYPPGGNKCDIIKGGGDRTFDVIHRPLHKEHGIRRFHHIFHDINALLIETGRKCPCQKV